MMRRRSLAASPPRRSSSRGAWQPELLGRDRVAAVEALTGEDLHHRRVGTVVEISSRPSSLCTMRLRAEPIRRTACAMRST